MPLTDFPAQKDVVALLQRSLERGRLGHAYLFTGQDLAELEAVDSGPMDEDAAKKHKRELRYWRTRLATAQQQPAPDGDVVAFHVGGGVGLLIVGMHPAVFGHQRVTETDGDTVAVGLGPAVFALLLAGGLSSEGAYRAGWVLQGVAISLGVLVPMMFFLGAVFGLLWGTADLLGRKIDRERAAAYAALEDSADPDPATD